MEALLKPSITFKIKRKLRIAQEQARQQVQNDKPKLVFSNPYDITSGWRNTTEDAAREDKYTALNLGATPEEAEQIYNDALPKTSVENQYSAFSKLAKNPKSRLWQELRATLKDLPKENYESAEELIRDLRSVGSTYANDYADILERGADKDFWFNYVRNLKKYAPAIIPVTVGTATLTNK